MLNVFSSVSAPRNANFLWVDLTREAHTALGDTVGTEFDIRHVREPTQIPGAIQVHAPRFLCFEFDKPDVPGIAALAHIRRAYPGLPVLMITGRLSAAVAIWALRVRVWDLLVKPVSIRALSQRITALIELTRRGEPGLETLFQPQRAEALSALHGPGRQERTKPALTHVAAHFDQKIALHLAAALCGLKLSQFCSVFRLEQGLTFGQYLLRYRIERACERLAQPDVLVKEVAYSVGFNDLSYFTRAFKRQLGVCPSDYQASARSS